MVQDKVLDLVNTSGYPFQYFCAQSILDLGGFQVANEVPFTDPPSNGPLRGSHGQIDILACSPEKSGRGLVCFVIECKRANNKIKNWVFSETISSIPGGPVLLPQRLSRTVPVVLRIFK